MKYNFKTISSVWYCVLCFPFQKEHNHSLDNNNTDRRGGINSRGLYFTINCESKRSLCGKVRSKIKCPIKMPSWWAPSRETNLQQMESPRLASVSGEGCSTSRVDAVDPVVQLHLTGSLEQIGVSECCRETEDKVALGMFRYWLEDGSVHDDQMFRCRLHWSALV